MKIGIFDSGLGGLTVVKAITQTFKGANLFYVADTANAPYGEKSPKQILDYSLTITRHLLDTHHIDALIVACNTATSAAIITLREHYPELIIIGAEPAIKPALQTTQSGKVGVLATPATLEGDKYQQLADRLNSAKRIELFEQACPGLVEQIERGEIGTQETHAMLLQWLAPMKQAGVDTIVLGCTHYPLASRVIRDIMGDDIHMIDVSPGIAKRLLSLSLERGHGNGGKLHLSVFTTGEIESRAVQEIVGNDIKVKRISV